MNRGALMLAIAGCIGFGCLAPDIGKASSGYRVLYSFGGYDDGAFPTEGLTEFGGALYGTTSEEGPHGGGTVFRLDHGGAERVLYGFATYGVTGQSPAGRLVTFQSGLYGTTSWGGAYGDGVVFAINKSMKLRVIHSFGARGDCSRPATGLTLFDGVLYGTTTEGGATGGGCIFTISPSGAERIIYSFPPIDFYRKVNPSAIVAFDGALYGTTSAGGDYGYGTVFSIDANGTEKTLHSFGDNTDGRVPHGGLYVLNGLLYGATHEGGDLGYGTVFSIDTNGSERVLHSFGAGSDGKSPTGGLVAMNGMLYGTTSEGGGVSRGSCDFGCGILFSIDSSGVESVLHNFGAKLDGAIPSTGLIAADGILYGTTASGGTKTQHRKAGFGTVFAFTP